MEAIRTHRHSGSRAAGHWPAAAFLVAALVWPACVSCASAEYFNRTAAAAGSKPDQVLAAMALRPGQSVADIGSGGGYFALRFARAVGPTGTVYAVDVNKEFLAHVRKQAAAAKLDNVRPIAVQPGQHGLAAGSVDVLFMRNVFHHLGDPVAFFQGLQPALRPGARVFVIENTPKGSYIGHGTEPKKIQRDLVRAGYRVLRSEKFLLPKQSFLIFGFVGK